MGLMLNMAANLADILDGPIARSLPKRHPSLSAIGSKLDTYSDMVSHFVVPASLLMQLSSLDLLYVGLATIWVVTGIVRQSYFEVIERCDDGECIFGVTSDYMPPLFAMSMHLLPVVGVAGLANWVLPALAGSTLFMIYGSLTLSMKTRRYGGFGLTTVTLFNASLCISMAVMLMRGSLATGAPLGLWSFEGLSLGVHLLLAYPCYFRFVELNLHMP
jgi:phosphatidylserine synthase